MSQLFWRLSRLLRHPPPHRYKSRRNSDVGPSSPVHTILQLPFGRQEETTDTLVVLNAKCSVRERIETQIATAVSLSGSLPGSSISLDVCRLDPYLPASRVDRGRVNEWDPPGLSSPASWSPAPLRIMRKRIELIGLLGWLKELPEAIELMWITCDAIHILM